MPKFTVSCDLYVPVVTEIEAPNEADAEEMLNNMSLRDLLKQANTEEASLGIVDGSVDVSPGAPD